MTGFPMGAEILDWLSALLMAGVAAAVWTRQKPPVAVRKEYSQEVHGATLEDEFSWLADPDDLEVVEYLKAENQYTGTVLADTEALQSELYKEMVGRIKETDRTAPVPYGPYFYYTRTVQGLQYSIHCRRREEAGSIEEVLLDENELAKDYRYFQLGVFEISPDHEWLAWSADTEGSEKFTLHIKHLKTGRSFDEPILNTADSAAWAPDGRSLFYVVNDRAHRPYRVMRHDRGKDDPEDVVSFEELDESFFVSVSLTRSKRFLLVTTASHRTSAVLYLDSRGPGGEFRPVLPRQPDVEFEVDHHGDRFLVVTNLEAPDFRLLELPVGGGLETATERIANRPGIQLEGVLAFRDHLAIFERERGLTRLRVQDLLGGETRAISFPEQVAAVSPGPNPTFETKTLRCHYTSFVTPGTDYDLDLQTSELTLVKRQQVVGQFDREEYWSERVMVTGSDGVKIPVDVVGYGRQDTERKPQALYLYGYGAYGISIDPYFSSARLSLLKRGVLFAVAHVRGGGEFGKTWHEGGRTSKKKNSFNDLISSAEYLVAEGYTAPDRLGVGGGSAGGLLVGASLNLRPDLFRAAVLEVPFVDLMNSMLDPELPLTVVEYGEWGDPRNREEFEYMLSYCPYRNLNNARYPDLLVTAGLTDPRVPYWGPAKWVARLRTRSPASRVVLKTHLESGHMGASGRYDYLREISLKYAFISECL